MGFLRRLFSCEKKKEPELFLCWYSAENDELIGQEKLRHVTKEQIRKWFYLDDDDEELDGLIVCASQRMHLQRGVWFTIDLNLYDYFVEYFIDN